MFRFLLTSVLVILSLNGFSQSSKKIIYKKVDTLALSLEVLLPQEMNVGQKYPAIVFFFGGGWNSGTTTQFEQQARYLSSRGMISVLVDYRVKNSPQYDTL